jgi:mitogen-activated protein kinase 1/3
MTNQTAKKFVQGLQTKNRTPISQVIKYTNPDALDLLDKMLEINPS